MTTVAISAPVPAPTASRAEHRAYWNAKRAAFFAVLDDVKSVTIAAAQVGVSRRRGQKWASKAGIHSIRARHPGRARYAALRAQGMSRTLAAAEVGVSTRSGYDWDHGVRYVQHRRVYPNGRSQRGAGGSAMDDPHLPDPTTATKVLHPRFLSPAAGPVVSGDRPGIGPGSLGDPEDHRYRGCPLRPAIGYRAHRRPLIPVDQPPRGGHPRWRCPWPRGGSGHAPLRLSATLLRHRHGLRGSIGRDNVLIHHVSLGIVLLDMGPAWTDTTVMLDAGLQLAEPSASQADSITEYSLEELGVLAESDVIFISADSDGRTAALDTEILTASPLWQTLPAVQAGNIFAIPYGASSLGADIVLVDRLEEILTVLSAV